MGAAAAGGVNLESLAWRGGLARWIVADIKRYMCRVCSKTLVTLQLRRERGIVSGANLKGLLDKMPFLVAAKSYTKDMVGADLATGLAEVWWGGSVQHIVIEIYLGWGVGNY